MRKLAFKICLFVIGALLVSSCDVVFQNPISKNSKIDKRLLGKWKNVEPNEKGFIEFAKKSDHQINIVTPDDDAGKTSIAFTASTIKYGNYYFMNLVPANKDNGNLVVRYQIQKDEMTIWIMNFDKMSEVLKRIKLKGYAKNPQAIFPGPIIITDSTENIKEFLKSQESDEVFEFFAKLKKSEEILK